MYKYLLFYLLWVPLPLPSQPARLHGVVNVLNSRFDTGRPEYLAGVRIGEISQPDSLFVNTDSNGRFDLTLAGDPEKAPVYLRVSREGYQVVNEQRLCILPGGPDTLQIIMADNHYVAIARQRYYDLAYSLAVKNLLQQFNEKKQAFETLQNQAETDAVRINTLRIELSSIFRRFETLDYLAAYFSTKYAGYNLDNTPPVFQDACRLLQRGEPDSAFNLLQRLDLATLLKRELAATKPAQPGNDLTRGDLIKLLELKTNLQYIRMELDSAEIGFETLIQLDSNGLLYHHDFARFLIDQNRTWEARVQLEKCFSLATLETDSAFLYIALARSWAAAGKLEEAEQAAGLGLVLSDRLARRDSAQYAAYLTLSNMSLAFIYHVMRRIPEAESLLLRTLAINMNLIQADPEQYEPVLAVANMVLGKCYLEMNRRAEGEKFILKSQEIYERLAKADSIRYNPHVASALESLGRIYSSQQKIEDAERCYLRALERYELLAQNIPPYFETSVAETAGYLGNLYYDRRKLPASEKMLRRALEIQERYTQYDLTRFGPGLGYTAMSLGICYYQLQKISQAERMLRRALEVREQLIHTDSLQYGQDLAYTANLLGRLYLEQEKLPEAEKMLLRAVETLEPLAQRDFEHFGPALASTAHDVGTFYLQYTNSPMTEDMLLRAVETFTRLVPYDTASFEPGLASVTLNLALFRLLNGQFEDAAAWGSKALSLMIKYIPTNGIANREEYRRAGAITATLRDSLAAHRNYPAAIALQQLRTTCADSLRPYNLAPDSMVATEYGNLSWQFLFNSQYAEAEQAARKALDLDNTQYWDKSNLGHAFLLRGDLNMAKQVYSDYLKADGAKAKSMLLSDFDLLEAGGVRHGNIAKARKWVGKR